MRAVIYARYSRGPKQTDQSIEGQLRVCHKFCEDHDLEVVEEYIDRHITGTSDQRPEFQRMVADAKKHKFEALVLYDTKRFSRNKYDSVIYKAQIKKAGVQIFYATENISDTPEGVLLESVLEGLAQYESMEMARKIKRGMYETALKGKTPGTTPSYGYRVNSDGFYVIEETEAKAIKYAFDRYLKGASFAEISRNLNELGYRTRKGKPFSGQAIKRILTNRRYIGEFTFMDIVKEDGIPAIIDKDTFFMVQKKLKNNERTVLPKGDFALTGKLICGVCETFMTGTSGTSKTGKIHYYYKCPGHKRKNINRDYLEGYITDQVREVFSDPVELDNIASKMFDLQQKENSSEAEIKTLTASLAKIQASIDNVVNAIATGVSSQALLDKLEDLESQKAGVQAELEYEKTAQIGLSKDQLKAALMAFLRGLPNEDDATAQRRILDVFVNKVYLYDDKLLIYFNVSGSKGLKSQEVKEFEQATNWWTTRESGRTLVCWSHGFALVVDLK